MARSEGDKAGSNGGLRDISTRMAGIISLASNTTGSAHIGRLARKARCFLSVNKTQACSTLPSWILYSSDEIRWGLSRANLRDRYVIVDEERRSAVVISEDGGRAEY